MRIILALIFTLSVIAAKSQSIPTRMVELNKEEYGHPIRIISGDNGYYLLTWKVPKDKGVDYELIHLNQDLKVSWKSKVATDLEKGIASFARTKICVGKDICVFYSEVVGNKLTERVVRFNKDGERVGEPQELINQTNANFVSRYIEGNIVYLMPFEIEEIKRISVFIDDPLYEYSAHWNLQNLGKLAIYAYDLSTNKVTYNRVDVGDVTQYLWLPRFHDNGLFWQTTQDGARMAHSLNLSTHEYKSIATGGVTSSSEVIGTSIFTNSIYDLWYSDFDNCVIAKYSDPSYFKIKNKEKGAFILGKLEASFYGASKQSYSLNYSDEMAAKVALYGKGIGLKKGQRGLGYQPVKLFKFDNGNYVSICERAYDKVAEASTNKYACDILVTGFNGKGEVLSEGLIDRKFQYYGDKRNPITYQTENSIKVLYGGPRPTAKGGKGLYLATIDATGKIVSDRKLSNVHMMLVNDFYVVPPTMVFPDDYGNLIIFLVYKKKDFQLFRVKTD